MDIRCTRCGEPWDMDTLHEEIDYRHETGKLPKTDGNQAVYSKQYDTVKGEFFSKGCAAFTFAITSLCEKDDNPRNQIIAALYDAFGDDLDGVASDIDDYTSLGLL